jgi:hypothetical protein
MERRRAVTRIELRAADMDDEAIMRGVIRIVLISGMVLFSVVMALATAAAADDHDAFVIVFKDGHRQSLATAEVDHIDIKAPATIVYKTGRREKISGEIDRIEFADAAHALITPGRAHYIGKWEVDDGAGNRFFITLESDGDARKSTGSPHGTWSLVDGEARIHWEDGWSDVIAKVGTRHEKRAYEPGRSFDDSPSNVTYARNTEPKPI